MATKIVFVSLFAFLCFASVAMALGALASFLLGDAMYGTVYAAQGAIAIMGVKMIWDDKRYIWK